MSHPRSSFAAMLAAAALVAAVPALAHHSPAGYEMQKQITLAGTVTSFE